MCLEELMPYPDDEILRLDLLVQQVRECDETAQETADRLSEEWRQENCEFAIYLDQFTSTLCGRKAVGTDLETEQARCQKHLS